MKAMAMDPLHRMVPARTNDFMSMEDGEISDGIQSVAYLYKYIFKGGNQTSIKVVEASDKDEGNEYLRKRCLCSMEETRGSDRATNRRRRC